MVPKGEKVLDSDHGTLVFRVFFPHHHQQIDLSLGHFVALFLISDYLDSHFLFLAVIVSLEDSAEGATAENILKFVTFLSDVTLSPLELTHKLGRWFI